MVGFIMLGYYEAQNYYTIWKLMIDTHYQNKGYGKVALKLGIDYLVNHFNVKEVYTAYEMNNSVAKKFYISLGFRETGIVVGNDVGMKLIVKDMSDDIPDYL